VPGTYISTGIKGQPASNQNSKGVKIIQLPCTTRRRQRRRWLRPYLPIVSTTRLHGSMLQLRHAKVFSFFPQTLPLSPSPLKLNSTCLIQVATSSAQLASYPVKNILDHRCGERKKIKNWIGVLSYRDMSCHGCNFRSIYPSNLWSWLRAVDGRFLSKFL